MKTRHKPIAVSMGEPAGIGPELALLAWTKRKSLGLPPFYVRGDRSLFIERARTIGLKPQISSCAATGTTEQVHDQVAAFIQQTGADELIVVAQIFDHNARVHSYELAMQACAEL